MTERALTGPFPRSGAGAGGTPLPTPASDPTRQLAGATAEHAFDSVRKEIYSL